MVKALHQEVSECMSSIGETLLEAVPGGKPGQRRSPVLVVSMRVGRCAHAQPSEQPDQLAALDRDATPARLVGQPRRGIDDPGRSHDDADVAVESGDRPLQDFRIDRFAEPHDPGARESAAVGTSRGR